MASRSSSGVAVPHVHLERSGAGCGPTGRVSQTPGLVGEPACTPQTGCRILERMKPTTVSSHATRRYLTIGFAVLAAGCAFPAVESNRSAEDRYLTGDAFLHPDHSDPTTHLLEAGPETVAWGFYWSEAEPVLRVQSGDIVDVTTMLTSSPTRLEAAGISEELVEPALRAIYDQVDDRGPGGHILTGPIYVEDADAGDVLEVRVLGMQMPLPYGYNGCSGFMPEQCPKEREDRTRIFWLDTMNMVSEYRPAGDPSGSDSQTADGPLVRIPLAPFFGSMGVAPPPDAGRWSSVPPWIHAGNIDNRELVEGTSLFIPVHVPGALFEVGDGHAAQGDGEVDQTAIETSLRGQLQLVVHKGWSIAWPRGETPSHWIAMGSDEDLTVATRIAIEQAIALIGDEWGIEPGEAYRLISLACDLRITQLVDRKVGVHVMIPKALVG